MRFLALSALALVTAGCTAEDVAEPQTDPLVAPILTSAEAQDEFTFARPLEARVKHVSLDLNLDFEAKRVEGTATLDIEKADDATEIVLDSNGLVIGGVTDGQGNAVEWEFGDRVEGKGEPLVIQLGDSTGPDLDQLVISYASAPDADALQWLDPQQTAGGEYPFLFSQGQAINNRTWIPTQDSPGIRQTWDARITAPDPLKVVMSGIIEGEPEPVVGQEGVRAFRFKMDNPVAPYLIAIAAGDIEFAELGPRSGVWAEPVTLPRAKAELADTEAMMDAGEKLYGDYRWGRYDMIVLPPSFPYGGMENPVMTFLTPTFIAGDRSLTGLVAHELAHSWSGNLVTNANWTDSWLNEGVTSYFENRIVEEIYGKKRADQEAALSFAAIEETLAEVGTDAPGTALHQPANTDPVGSAIVYDKGAFFLRTVESIVGRDRFDAWLTQWFDNHAFQPATSAMILADMEENLVKDEAEAEKLKLREWIYEPGLPDNVARPDAAAFADVDKAAKAFTDDRSLDKAAWDKWTSAERQRFLAKIPRKMSNADLAALDDALSLSGSGNNEELFLWLELAMQNRYEAAVPTTEKFLAEVGRRKFVAPLFEALMDQGSWGQPIARRIYARTRSGYHAVTRGTVDAMVNG